VVLGWLLLFPACGSSNPSAADNGEFPGVPYRVADLAPGSASSFAQGAAQLADADGPLLFRADDGRGGLQLWRSDGSAGGTAALATAALGSTSASSSSFAWVRPQLFFDADDGVHGRELWRSDGTAGGTRLVKDLVPGPGAETLSRFTNVGGVLLFFASLSPAPRSITYKLLRSDGTSDGTALVRELGTRSTGGSNPPVLSRPIEVGGRLFFSWGKELWRSDGSAPGTVPFFDGLSLSGTVSLARSRGRLVFLTGGYGPNGLWFSDGTAEGTGLVQDLGEDADADGLLTAASGRLFFTTEHEVWTSDGTPAGTAPVFAFSGARPRGVATVGETLVFNLGTALWRTDGTAAGTLLLAGAGPYAREALTVGRWLYFRADDGLHGEELWRTDGTVEGTALVSDIWPGPSAARPSNFVLAGPRLFFTADDGRTGRELWAIMIGARP